MKSSPFSTDILYLLKSLSKSEKRYFKVNYYKLSNGKNYMKLLDTIEEKKKYHNGNTDGREEGLSHIPSEKTYLFNSILKGMRSYNAAKNIRYVLNSLLADIYFLYEKRLHQHCLKKIKTAKKLCYVHEEHFIILELIKWERKLLKFPDLDNLENYTRKLSNEKKAVFDLLKTESEISDLYNEMLLALKKGYSKPMKERKKMATKIIAHKLLKDYNKLPSFSSKRFFHSIKALYFEIINDRIQAKNWNKKLIILLDEKKLMIEKDPDNYKVAIYNYLSNCIHLQDFDDFLPYVLKAKSIRSESIEEKAMDFQNFSFLELFYHLNTGKFEKALDIIPEIEDGIKRHALLMNKQRLVSFYYNMVILFLIVEDFKGAIKWSRKALSENFEARADIQNSLRILQLVMYYESSEPQVVQYIYDTTFRFYDKKGLMTSFETKVFNLIKELLKTSGIKEKTSLIKKFRDELEQSKEQRLGVEELSAWATSRITGKPIKEIMRKKINQEISKKTRQSEN